MCCPLDGLDDTVRSEDDDEDKSLCLWLVISDLLPELGVLLSTDAKSGVFCEDVGGAEFEDRDMTLDIDAVLDRKDGDRLSEGIPVKDVLCCSDEAFSSLDSLVLYTDFD